MSISTGEAQGKDYQPLENEFHLLKIYEHEKHIDVPVFNTNEIQKKVEGKAAEIINEVLSKIDLQGMIQEAVKNATKNIEIKNAVIKDIPVNNALITDVPVKNAVIQDVPVKNAILQDKLVINAVIKDEEVVNAIIKDVPVANAIIKTVLVTNAIIKEEEKIIEKPKYVDKEIINPILRDRILYVSKILGKNGEEIY